MLLSILVAAGFASAARVTSAVVTPVAINAATPAPVTPIGGPSAPAASPVSADVNDARGGGGMLTGAMASYAWFPGRWACRTALMSMPAKDPAAGRLYVTVDASKNSVKEIFTTTTQDGKAYRSDGVLTYDMKRRVFERKTVDRNGTQIALITPGPFSAKMAYEGYAGLQDRKVYRMRATITYDVTQSQMTTSTAFWDKATKTWPVQTTTVCSKIDQ